MPERDSPIQTSRNYSKQAIGSPANNKIHVKNETEHWKRQMVPEEDGIKRKSSGNFLMERYRENPISSI